MSHTPEVKARISAAIKARYESDPTYRQKVSAAGKRGRAKQISEVESLRAEVKALRAEVARLKGEA